MRPHGRQPTRVPRPWVSPGKNTGVGFHFLLQCTKVKSQSEVAQSCATLSNPMDCSLQGFSIHGIFQARVLEWGTIAFSRQTANLKNIQPTYATQVRKNKWPNQTMGQRNRHFSKKDIRWLTNTWKDAQHHSLSEKCKSKPIWGTISHQSEWLQSKSLQAINAGEGVEKREPSYTVGGNAN